MRRIILGAVLIGATAVAQAQVRVIEPWIRSTVPGQQVAAAYMRLQSDVPMTLVGASTPIARIAELHQTTREGDVTRMAAVNRLDVAPGKTVELKPMGYHLMLTDIAAPLTPGEVVPIRLEFEDSSKKRVSVEVNAIVKDVMAPMHANEHKH